MATNCSSHVSSRAFSSHEALRRTKQHMPDGRQGLQLTCWRAQLDDVQLGRQGAVVEGLLREGDDGAGRRSAGPLAVENAAACASSACDRFWSTEYNCMNPLTSCGL